MVELDIKIIDRVDSRGGSRRRNYDVYVNTKAKNNRIHFGDNAVKKLSLQNGTELLFGHLGDRFYIAKRNEFCNGHDGYFVKKHDKYNSYSISNRNLVSKMRSGYYKIGKEVMKSNVLWYELEFVKAINLTAEAEK
jgi:hypothetical protein